MMRIFRWVNLLLCLSTLFYGWSQEQQGSIPLDPELRYGKLNNGFTYYIRNFQDLSSGNKPGILAQLIGPGGRFEDKDQQGLAHLIEHMVLYTTTSHFGPFKNYFMKNMLGDYKTYYKMDTDQIRVRYGWGFPEDNSNLLIQNLQRLREFAQDGQMLKNLKDSEKVDLHGRKTVLEESSEWESSRTMQEKIYHIYGRGLPQYSPSWIIDKHNENIKTFPLKSLVRFYKDWYRPDKEALIIIGNVDVDQVEEQVKKLFSDLKMPEKPREKSLQVFQKMGISLPRKSQVITLIDSTRNSIELDIYYTHPTTKIFGRVTSEEQYRTWLIERLYNAMIRPRIANLSQQYNPPIQGSVMHLVKEITSSQVEAAQTRFTLSDASSIQEAFGLVVGGLEQVRRYGFTQKELYLAKEVVFREITANLKSQMRLADLYADHFLFGTMAPSPEYEREMMAHIIENISVDNVNNFAKKWLESPYWDVVFTVPKDIDYESLPREAEISKWITEIRVADMEPSLEQDLEGPKQLISEAKLQNLSKNVSYTQSDVKDIEVARLKLDNGIQIILKPFKKEGEGEIYLRGISPVGASVYVGEDYVMASNAAEIVRNSGAGGWDKFELANYNKSKNVSVSHMILDNESYINGSAPPQHLESMLQQIYLYATEPNKNKEAFKDWLPQGKIRLQRRNVFRDLADTEVLGGDKRDITVADLDRISLDKVLALYKDVFSNTGNFIFVVAGDFEVRDVKPLLLRYLGNLPTHDENEVSKPGTRGYEKLTPQKGLHKTFYSEQNDSFVHISYVGDYEYDMATNLKMEILEESLNSIIIDKGITAGLYRSVMLGLIYNDTYFRFQTSTNGIADVEKAKTVIQEVVTEFREQGPNAKIFLQAIGKMREKLQNYLKSPLGWVNYQSKHYKNSGDLADIGHQLELLNRLTPVDIQDTARRYLTKENLSIIEMLPENLKLTTP